MIFGAGAGAGSGLVDDAGGGADGEVVTGVVVGAVLDVDGGDIDDETEELDSVDVEHADAMRASDVAAIDAAAIRSFTHGSLSLDGAAPASDGRAVGTTTG